VSIFRLFRPSRSVLLVFAMLMAVSSFTVRQYLATSKVQANIETGWPMPYLWWSRYHGPCGPVGGCRGFAVRDQGWSLCGSDGICVDFSLRSFDPAMFGIDVLTAYAAASLLARRLCIISPPSKVKAIVTAKR
jgi:hypothetical protein